MSLNCPVCNKAGLPDYTKEDVICPQCNSDLKAIRLLNTIANEDKSKNPIKFIYILSAIVAIALVFTVLFFNSNNKVQNLVSKNRKLTETVLIQTAFNEELKSTPTPKVDNSKHVIVNYTVKRADNLYKISRFFYGDGNKYHQIVKDNNLEVPYILDVGQMLKIKIDIQ